MRVGVPFRMDGTKIGVLKQTNKICLSCLLDGRHRFGLEPDICLVILGYLTHKALEWCLAQEKLCRLLVATNLPQGN